MRIDRRVFLGSSAAAAVQIEIWNLEKQAQAAGFAVAKIGAPCEAVDAAARKVITDAGLGPDYKVPGLPHRTGHGIGSTDTSGPTSSAATRHRWPPACASATSR